ncbi:5-formyltetrahydrofolate cyclo-ligase [Acinetobacter qingfengensis]|uniref:5-formyltetrahydrofolate cyclo-ligase n=1 Tax=Acinetobacter qingfengensis TaxID=1262585 RepID=A0A1E7R9D2_9GAMM|nr:5-formyltetrahydrofolate cyclo-ligase [Acinetobacter qingfengensis]KAA8735460.1 5-formyltetrahydrofolate cyclo-ligase [Acinetobacter qingfengensis]OEY95895.1 5-formyltetrahydrofolate cyclo-ligase [Acinetobacter qingfengensis]
MQIAQLRQQIRRQRRHLSQIQLRQAELALMHRIIFLKEMQHAQRIGIYLDAFGEIPTRMLIEYLFKQHKKVYLPLICNMNQQLRWQPISLQQYHNQRFAKHRLGMQQAIQQRGQLFKVLDAVIMPLVLFDRMGHRIGMGGGFYDRTLASARYVKRIGLAHDFQQVNSIISTQHWDQDLDVICTPKHIYRYKRR